MMLDLPSELATETALKLAPGDLHYINKADSGGRYRGSDVSRRIVQLYGDSATFDHGPYKRYNRHDYVSAIRATRFSSFVMAEDSLSGMITVSGQTSPALSMISAGTIPGSLELRRPACCPSVVLIQRNI
jgi:hypothetical protein